MPLTEKQDEKWIEALSVFSPRPLQSLVDVDRFFVEFEELEKLRVAITTHENALVIGERGSGKSSLFNHLYFHFLQEDLPKPMVPVRFSVLMFREFNQTNFLKGLINNIFDAAIKYRTGGEKIKNVVTKLLFSPEEMAKLKGSPFVIDAKYSKNEVREKDDPEYLSETLVSLVETLHKRNVQLFIILDDTDKQSPEAVWGVFRGMRDMLWGLRMSFILSSLPEQVSEITKPPLDQFFPYWIKMRPFDEKMTKELISRRLKYLDLDVSINDDALEYMVSRTRGNPRSIITMMKNVFESYKPTNVVTLDHVRNLGLPYSFDLTDTERAVISFLANNPGTSASSREFVESIQVTRSRLAQILNELKEKNLVEAQKDGKKVKYSVTGKILTKQGP
jgi:DNA-binding MarR family transcriptional regulator/energy-coupling factor transporter ATP-binding protein EcfA2